MEERPDREESLPLEVEDALADAILRASSGGDDPITALVEEHPEYAQALRERARVLTGTPSPITPLVGPYELLGVLGKGGMGTVYRARQREPLEREVAVKVIRGGTREVLARFELERQALAVMSHPAIAEVYDAGVTDSGQPYFVMELVEGRPLTEYCDAHRLALEERVALFEQVCLGVQHAHRKGVLHRDLKPGNVLVAEGEDGPAVKIIDFGLARALDERLAGESVHTLHGQLLGTPEYMSPEQAGGDTRGVDTRTDVYALGVMLYELLCGALPVDTAALREGSTRDIQRRLLEATPPAPSQRASAAKLDEDVLRARRTTRASLRRRLRGDLDWIVMRAMAREPERRYESPADLALELERYLAGAPVQAGPPSAIYRLRKFVRRYRGRVLAASLLLLSLVAGLIGTTIGMAEAHAQQARTEEALSSLHEISRWFVVDLHDQLDDLPGTLDARRELVAKGLAYLDELARQRAGDPDLALDAARGYLRVGAIQGWPFAANLGDSGGALASFSRARELALRVERMRPGTYPTPELRVDAHLRTADVHVQAMEFDEADAALDAAGTLLDELEGVARRRLALAVELRRAHVHMCRGDSQGGLASYAAAEALLTTDDVAAAADEDLHDIGSLYKALGGAHSSEFLPGALWDPARARECLGRALEAYLELARRHPGRASNQRLAVTTRLGLAGLDRRTGAPERAIEGFRGALVSLEALLDLNPTSVLELDYLQTAAEGLARTLRDEGELDAAAAAFERAAVGYERKLEMAPEDANERSRYATALEMLAGVHVRRDDVEQVRAAFARSLAARARVEDGRACTYDDYHSTVAARRRLLALLVELGALPALTEELVALSDDLARRLAGAEGQDPDRAARLRGALELLDAAATTDAPVELQRSVEAWLSEGL